MYVDAHIHLHDFEEKDIKYYIRQGYTFLAVSEDLESSYKTLTLARLYEKVIPAIGIHPWEVEKVGEKGIREIERLVRDYNVPVLGEIGLDKLFVPRTFERQLPIFRKFLELAKEYNLAVNLHCAGAWRECFEEVSKYDLEKVYFHWYTGPIDLLQEIINKGHFIGINVAALVQEKHRKIIEEVPLENIITESDAPWKYKDFPLTPAKLGELIELISQIKNVPKEETINQIRKNFKKLLI